MLVQHDLKDFPKNIREDMVNWCLENFGAIGGSGWKLGHPLRYIIFEREDYNMWFLLKWGPEKG